MIRDFYRRKQTSKQERSSFLYQGSLLMAGGPHLISPRSPRRLIELFEEAKSEEKKSDFVFHVLN